MAWIEGKLKEHGVKKVVPDKETLTDAYHRMRRQIAVQEAIDEALEELGEEKKGRVPARLDERIRKALKKSPAMRWDAALRAIAERRNDDEPNVAKLFDEAENEKMEFSARIERCKGATKTSEFLRRRGFWNTIIEGHTMKEVLCRFQIGRNANAHKAAIAESKVDGGSSNCTRM